VNISHVKRDKQEIIDCVNTCVVCLVNECQNFCAHLNQASSSFLQLVLCLTSGATLRTVIVCPIHHI
jgi:hypothetical protein